MTVSEILESLAIEPVNSGACGGEWIRNPQGGELASVNPADGSVLAQVRMAGASDYERVVHAASEAFQAWRMLPAPKRGEVVRDIAAELRAHKEPLGALV